MLNEHFLLSLLNPSIDFTPEVSHPLSISLGHYLLYYQSSFLRKSANHKIISLPSMSIETLKSISLQFLREATREHVSCTARSPFPVLSVDKVDFNSTNMSDTSHIRQVCLVFHHNTVLVLNQHKFKDGMSNRLLRSTKKPAKPPPSPKNRTSLPTPFMFLLNNACLKYDSCTFLNPSL